MRNINISFTTTSENYDLLQDTTVKQELNKYGVNLDIKNTVLCSIMIIVNSPSKIKFNDNDYYEPFIGDTVYCSDTYWNFSKIIIKDNNISGLISISLG